MNDGRGIILREGGGSFVCIYVFMIAIVFLVINNKVSPSKLWLAVSVLNSSY